MQDVVTSKSSGMQRTACLDADEEEEADDPSSSSSQQVLKTLIYGLRFK